MTVAVERRTDLPRRSASARRKMALGGAVVLAAAAAGYGALAPSTPKQAPKAVAAVPVTVGAAATRDLPIWFGGIGTVTPLNMVDVRVRVDGQLQSVAFAEGQEVQAGQLLAQIDPRPYRALLAQAEANRQKDAAQLANLRLEVGRAEKLASAGAGTSQSLDTVKAQAAALQSTLEADAAMVEIAKLNLEFTRIVSPIAGRVGLRQVDPGSLVRATDARGLVTVTQMAPIGVLFSLPQDQLEAVVAGQGGGPLQVTVATRDGSKQLATGTLAFVNSSVDQANGQIQLKAVFDNPGRELWPGEFVTARVLVRTDRNATVVPAQAVQTGEAGLYAYAVRPDGTAEVRAVKVGPTIDGVTEIRTGLQPGEPIVVDGQSRLSPGALVRALQPTARAAEASP